MNLDASTQNGFVALKIWLLKIVTLLAVRVFKILHAIIIFFIIKTKKLEPPSSGTTLAVGGKFTCVVPVE